MLKEYRVFIALIAIAMLVTVAVIAQFIAAKNKVPSLHLEARVIPETEYSVREIPIKVVFRNREEEPVNLLHIFDDPTIIKSFFRFSLTNVNGTPIETLGGGKVSLSRNSFKYLRLQKGDKYAVILNLKDFLPNDHRLEEGVYNLSVTYLNQYGENCFKGSLESNTISVHLTE
jgi:hypothetical protein